VDIRPWLRELLRWEILLVLVLAVGAFYVVAKHRHTNRVICETRTVLQQALKVQVKSRSEAAEADRKITRTWDGIADRTTGPLNDFINSDIQIRRVEAQRADESAKKLAAQLKKLPCE
jgi:hypothetical protein